MPIEIALDSKHLHLLLLSGIQHGYPLPSQHPANILAEGDNFKRALDEAGRLDTARVLKNNKLVLTDAGLAILHKAFN